MNGKSLHTAIDLLYDKAPLNLRCALCNGIGLHRITAHGKDFDLCQKHFGMYRSGGLTKGFIFRNGKSNK